LKGEGDAFIYENELLNKFCCRFARTELAYFLSVERFTTAEMVREGFA
jgi:hypothetical protein